MKPHSCRSPPCPQPTRSRPNKKRPAALAVPPALPHQKADPLNLFARRRDPSLCAPNVGAPTFTEWVDRCKVLLEGCGLLCAPPPRGVRACAGMIGVMGEWTGCAGIVGLSGEKQIAAGSPWLVVRSRSGV